MTGHDVIAVGASAGGVEALTRLVAGLPPALPATVLVVLHLPAHAESHLPAILRRAGPLPARQPRHGEPLRHGHVFVASPDRHLIVEDGRVWLRRGPHENRHRPAVDPLLRSAAIACGPRVIGVVLSGAGGDGAAGLRAVKRRGGLAVVQAPEDALFTSMPERALAHADVDFQVPVGEMGGLLAELVQQAAPDGRAFPIPADLMLEQRYMAEEPQPVDLNEVGTLSSLTCPECEGPLWELRDGDLLRYRCRVGHAFTGEDAVAARADQIEQDFWSVLNRLEESVLLAERLAAGARARGYERAAASFADRANQARHRATLVRRVLEGDPPTE